MFLCITSHRRGRENCSPVSTSQRKLDKECSENNFDSKQGQGTNIYMHEVWSSVMQNEQTK